MPNVNVSYAETQAAARQLQAGEQTIEGDLARLKRLVDQLVAGGYVTDTSSKQFEASYTQFNTGATKMVQGLTGMGQYLGRGGQGVPRHRHPAGRLTQAVTGRRRKTRHPQRERCRSTECDGSGSGGPAGRGCDSGACASSFPRGR